jgi:hypothetical protein
MPICSDLAWNNFIMRDEPARYERGNIKRAAAVAGLFMSSANSGGLNSFLTSSFDLDAAEVVEALTAIGAAQAARQLVVVLDGLGTSLSASSQEDRWSRLEADWTEDLDAHDVLTAEADEELLEGLTRHVAANEAYYASLA